MKVTLEILVILGACPSGRRQFFKDYPDGLEITGETIREAYTQNHDVFWFRDEAMHGNVVVQQKFWAAREALTDLRDLSGPITLEYAALIADTINEALPIRLAELERAKEELKSEFPHLLNMET